MSGTIDDRVVGIEFDNKNFDSRIAATIASLDKLTESINKTTAQPGLGNLSKDINSLDVSHMASGIDNISSKFSALGAIGFSAIQNITNSILNFIKSTVREDFLGPVITGGKERALNIEQAKFMFRGLNIDVEEGMKSAREAVLGTAYGLDEAAKAAAQFAASGIEVGPKMTGILQGVAGTAALTGSSFSEMAQIFTSSAALGKVTNQDLDQFATRGLNAAAKFAEVIGKTEAEVRIMARDGEIDFKTFAEAMDEAFGEHATKANETYTGSLANMRAAMRRMGEAFIADRLVQQRDIFNALTPVIDSVTKALKPLFGVINEFTRAGADKLIGFLNGLKFDNFKNAILIISEGLRHILIIFRYVSGIAKSAFRDIFPKGTTSLLIKVADLFYKLSHFIQLNKESVNKIQNVFRGLFSILAIGIEVVKEVFKFFWQFTGVFKGAGGGALDLAEKIGLLLQKLRRFLVDEGGIHKFFVTLTQGIKDAIEWIKNFIANIDKFFDSFKKDVGAEASVNRITDRFEQLNNVIDKLKTGKLGQFFDKVKEVFDKTWEYMKNWFSELGSKLADAFKPGDFDSTVDLINVGLLGGIGVMLTKFFSSGFLSTFKGGIILKVSRGLNMITSRLEAMQVNIKADTLMKIAIALGILTASILVLSLIDSVALASALAAMGVAFGQLAGMLLLLDKIALNPMDAIKIAIMAGAMIGLAAAMLLLGIALKIMSTMSWGELAVGLAGVAGSLLIMIGAMHLMPSSPMLILTGAGILIVAAALIVLAGAVKLFSMLSWDEIGRGLGAIGLALVIIAGAMHLMPVNLPITAIGLTILAVALGLLAGAVKLFGNLSWEEIGKGLLAIGLALIIIAGAMNLMPIWLPVIAAGLIGVALALVPIAGVIKLMGEMKLGDLAKGVGALAVVMGILAISLNLMAGAIPGALALIIAAGALVILSGVIERLGSMKIGDIVKGLLALAGIFIIIGVAGLVLGIISPLILGMAIALGVLGAAMALFGLGAFLLAKAFQMMSDSGDAGLNSLLDIIDTFMTALPNFAKTLVTALVGAVEELLKALPLLLRLAEAFLSQLLDLVITLAPKIGQAMIVIATEGLRVIREKFPDIVATGFTLLMELLRGIRDNIEEIATLAIEIVVKLATTLTNNAQQLVDAGINLLLAFLTAIAERAPDIVFAGLNILVKLLEGIATNIKLVIEAVANIITTFITEVGLAGERIAVAGANAIIKFVEGLGREATRVSNAGIDAVYKFLDGVVDKSIDFVTKCAILLTHFLNAMAEVIRTHGEEIRRAGRNLAGAIGDGLIDGLEEIPVVGKFVGLFRDGVKAVKDEVEGNSPSKVFMRIGESIVQGLVMGLDSDEPKKSIVAHAQHVINAFNKAIYDAKKHGIEIGDINPVITPVVDLTKVNIASKRLAHLMSVPALTPQASINKAKTIAHAQYELDKLKSNINTIESPRAVKFEQNIFAPTALSTNDIYRNTKSQIVMAKEELNIP